MSEFLIVTLGLLAGVVGCLARPCTPQHWAQVKTARPLPAALPVPELELEPVSEPGFADGLAAAPT